MSLRGIYVGPFLLSVFFCVSYVGNWVCLFGELCWALRLSVFCVTYGGNWVSMFVWLGTCFLKWLCHLEQAQLINCFWNIW